MIFVWCHILLTGNTCFLVKTAWLNIFKSRKSDSACCLGHRNLSRHLVSEPGNRDKCRFVCLRGWLGKIARLKPLLISVWGTWLWGNINLRVNVSTPEFWVSTTGFWDFPKRVERVCEPIWEGTGRCSKVGTSLDVVELKSVVNVKLFLLFLLKAFGKCFSIF